MKNILAFAGLCLFFVQSSWANVWPVGPGKPYSKPSLVANLVADGDTVEIDPGLYAGDVCTWTANRLVLCGVGPVGQYAHLRADNQSAGGKAIWVIKGDSVLVENIEFSLCKVPDHNGAGIRAEGLHLRVSHCYFHHNEMGILTNNDNAAEYIIEHSEFAYNGYGDGYSHNVYVGSVKSLVFRYNYSHHGKVGHLLKSRAQNNFILFNRLTDEPGTDASREIDLPNGGTAIIMGNLIQQSAESQNGNIIGYGMEGLANTAPHELYIIHNTIVNQRFAGRFVMFPAGLATCKIQNNILAGPGTVMDTPANPTLLDTSHNVVLTDIDQVGFMDYMAFDYRLTPGSPAIDAAQAAGSAGTISFQPDMEYLHPLQGVARINSGLSDIGAHEFMQPLSVDEQATNIEVHIFPNPSAGQFVIESSQPISNLVFWDTKGVQTPAQVQYLSETKALVRLQDLQVQVVLAQVQLSQSQHRSAIILVQ